MQLSKSAKETLEAMRLYKGEWLYYRRPNSTCCKLWLNGAQVPASKEVFLELKNNGLLVDAGNGFYTAQA